MQGKAWKAGVCSFIWAAAVFVLPAGDALAQRDQREYRANLELRLMETENQMRRMTGQYEEAIHRLSQLTRRLEVALEDIEFRLRGLEQGAPNSMSSNGPAGPGSYGNGAGAPAVRSAGPAAQARLPAGAVLVPEPSTRQLQAPELLANLRPEDDPERFLVGVTPEERFAGAFRLVRREQLAEAEKAFRAFLTLYPDHGFSGNARYWLGKTYFEQSNYESAAITLLDTYQRHSDSAKGADILLYLALSLNEIGQQEDACIAFIDLESRYPDAGAVLKGRAAKGRRDARCK